MISASIVETECGTQHLGARISVKDFRELRKFIRRLGQEMKNPAKFCKILKRFAKF
jgi:hypothetical protein